MAISIVMSRAQPVECPWNRQDLSSLVPMMMSRAIQSQQGELILQLTRVMGGLAVQACADYCSEETTLSATETRAWKDVLTGLWGRAYHYRSAKKVDVPASEMREVVAKLRKKGARDQVLVDAFKEMMDVGRYRFACRADGRGCRTVTRKRRARRPSLNHRGTVEGLRARPPKSKKLLC